MPEFPRVARLDTDLVLRQLAETTGLVLAADGTPPGGQVGASYVRWPDGHRSVLTWQPPGTLSDVRRAASLLEAARAGGVPAPRYELVEELSAAVVIVQELLPGTRPTMITQRTVDSMIAISQRCRGLLAGRTDLPPPSLYLRTDGPGFCLHEPLRRYDRRTARLLDTIEEIGAALPEHLTGDDLVHMDFHPENVLVNSTGEVSGVVDWDAINRGNGDFDLLTLRFGLAHRAPDLGHRLQDQLTQTVPEDLARAAWAHLSLRLVDWSIRHLTPAHVTTWLDISQSLCP
jgi:aminoglycoside phosphotransferase (APT) family kinase protein